MTVAHCTNCRLPYPDVGIPYRCPRCGGTFDFEELPALNQSINEVTLPGIWKYKSSFGLDPMAPIISLGEGGTPLVWSDVHEKKVAFKCEYLNPTGSFKDRGSALLASFIKSRGGKYVCEDSSGNAGASFAAYAARASLHASIYVPDTASGPKQEQIERYGAQLVRIIGARSNAALAAQQAVDKGCIYASHAYLPFNIPGYATLAYELVEQLSGAPGTVIVPVGQGGLFLGLARGFSSLVNSRKITKMPKLVGVQALRCPPLWALKTYGIDGLRMIKNAPSVAEGIAVSNPVRGDALIHTCDNLDVELFAVDEENILPGMDSLARLGFLVEPTSAVVWDALMRTAIRWDDPIVVVLTGNGLKAIS